MHNPLMSAPQSAEDQIVQQATSSASAPKSSEVDKGSAILQQIVSLFKELDPEIGDQDVLNGIGSILSQREQVQKEVESPTPAPEAAQVDPAQMDKNPLMQ